MDVLKFLIKHGGDVNQLCVECKTPIIIAAEDGNQEAVELLLEHQARLDIIDGQNRSALYYAAMNNHLIVLKVELKSRQS